MKVTQGMIGIADEYGHALAAWNTAGQEAVRARLESEAFTAQAKAREAQVTIDVLNTYAEQKTNAEWRAAQVQLALDNDEAMIVARAQAEAARGRAFLAEHSAQIAREGCRRCHALLGLYAALGEREGTA